MLAVLTQSRSEKSFRYPRDNEKSDNHDVRLNVVRLCGCNVLWLTHRVFNRKGGRRTISQRVQTFPSIPCFQMTYLVAQKIQRARLTGAQRQRVSNFEVIGSLCLPVLLLQNSFRDFYCLSLSSIPTIPNSYPYTTTFSPHTTQPKCPTKATRSP